MRNFAIMRFCKKDILREILREKNLILLSRTYLVIDSNLQSAKVRSIIINRSIRVIRLNRFESFDQIDLSRYALRKKSFSKFFFLVNMRECARTNLSTLKNSDNVRTSHGQKNISLYGMFCRQNFTECRWDKIK